MHTRHAYTSTSLGRLTLVAEDDAISGLYFPGHWHRPSADALGPETQLHNEGVLRDAASQLDEYLAGERNSFSLVTVSHGTELQERVWAILKRIPFGATTTYGQIATELGDRGLAQAVGQAVGHNPISIIVPCHRVVGSSGKLTGFAGGLERKRALLDLEEPSAELAGRLF